MKVVLTEFFLFLEYETVGAAPVGEYEGVTGPPERSR